MAFDSQENLMKIGKKNWQLHYTRKNQAIRAFAYKENKQTNYNKLLSFDQLHKFMSEVRNCENPFWDGPSLTAKMERQWHSVEQTMIVPTTSKTISLYQYIQTCTDISTINPTIYHKPQLLQQLQANVGQVNPHNYAWLSKCICIIYGILKRYGQNVRRRRCSELKKIRWPIGSTSLPLNQAI